jgi:cation:H+ antiporter
MVLASLLFIAGLLLLYYGAEYLVTGSSRLALSYGIKPLIIGMTIVAFATSMPELLVSLLAAIRGSSDLAAGNIVGSNIANIALILGCAALLRPMLVDKSTLCREIPFMIGAALLLYGFCWDGSLGFSNGLVLFLLLMGFLFYCLRSAKQTRLAPDPDVEQVEEERGRRGKDFFLILVGIIGLAVGAELMVRSAMTIARHFGVSELVIGISIVALGTSLPELAASVVSAWKGEMDLSIGNVIGSNIFNILFVLGVCPMISPLSIDPTLLRIDMPVMIGFSFGLLLLSLKGRLGRFQGTLLLVCYALFIATLFWR